MIAQSMLELVGHTPLVRLNRIPKGLAAEVVVKLENLNPSGSVKDRAALAMLRHAARLGHIHSETLLVEPTSGNTGIGLAFVCAVHGWRLTLTMPESMSHERRALLQGLGANLVLTPASQGMAGAVQAAADIVASTPQAFLVGQFDNRINAEAHYVSTAEEIWADTEHELAAFVAGVGTGGTITGVGKRLHELDPDIQVVAVEPAESPLLSEGRSGPHGIQGIGANFVPGVYDPSVPDTILTVPQNEAMVMARRLMREEGILCGISSGANVCAATRLAADPALAGKRIVTIICDSAERYLSTGLFAQHTEETKES